MNRNKQSATQFIKSLIISKHQNGYFCQFSGTSLDNTVMCHKNSSTSFSYPGSIACGDTPCTINSSFTDGF